MAFQTFKPSSAKGKSSRAHSGWPSPLKDAKPLHVMNGVNVQLHAVPLTEAGRQPKMPGLSTYKATQDELKQWLAIVKGCKMLNKSAFSHSHITTFPIHEPGA
jgi:hypothetical protein